MPSPARIAAFDILRQVETGGYASDLLLAHTAALDSRDVCRFLRRDSQSLRPNP